jgi:hypothetical protein
VSDLYEHTNSSSVVIESESSVFFTFVHILIFLCIEQMIAKSGRNSVKVGKRSISFRHCEILRKDISVIKLVLGLDS